MRVWEGCTQGHTHAGLPTGPAFLSRATADGH